MLKKVNKIEVKSQRRRKKKHKPWIIRIFSHECYITYLTGCYSCWWKTKLEKKSRRGFCCRSLVQRDGKELDHTSWDVGNMGCPLPPWGLISLQNWACLGSKVCCNPGTSLPYWNIRLLLSLSFLTSRFPYFLFYITHLFTHFCFYSLSEAWRKREV